MNEIVNTINTITVWCEIREMPGHFIVFILQQDGVPALTRASDLKLHFRFHQQVRVEETADICRG